MPCHTDTAAGHQRAWNLEEHQGPELPDDKQYSQESYRRFKEREDRNIYGEMAIKKILNQMTCVLSTCSIIYISIYCCLYVRRKMIYWLTYMKINDTVVSGIAGSGCSMSV